MVIPSIKRTLETTPPLTGHPSIEGNYPGASHGKGKNRRLGFIPLYGWVARSAGVVSAFNCVNYYIPTPAYPSFMCPLAYRAPLAIAYLSVIPA
jgi:hypothetical protein